MADKMLIDATHPEETRVVVLRGNRVEEFDFESANRKQLRGNIYLAKVTRVEPSLQAAFVDYGGNRHGFLAFSEIHPDYYQIPVADRQALIAQEEHDQRAADAEADNRAGRRGGRHRHRHAGRNRDRDVVQSETLPPEQLTNNGSEMSGVVAGMDHPSSDAAEVTGDFQTHDDIHTHEHDSSAFAGEDHAHETVEFPTSEETASPDTTFEATAEGEQPSAAAEAALPSEAAHGEQPMYAGDAASPTEPVEPGENGHHEEHHEEEGVESVGGADALEEVQERVPRFRRQYKI